MGLDFDMCDAHWSYSGFARFRERLADEIGVTLGDMEGFGGTRSWDEVHDDIVPLLNHSDCDGELAPEECALVGPRLFGLVLDWGKDDYDRQQALLMVEGLSYCVKNKRAMQFD